jgi:RNA polymerase sigma-70 factor (ECF subfamily)
VRVRLRKAAIEPAERAGLGVVRSLPFEGDELALTAAMAAGRMDAMAAFYDRYIHGVHTLAFRLMGPDAELDDVVHEAFVRAFESLPRLRDPRLLRAWLFGITVRTVRIRFQKRARQRWLRFMAPEDLPEVTTFAQTELSDALRDVYAILSGMDGDERIALVLNRVQGLSLEEAARTAKTSLATFRRRLARGEAKFFARARRYPTLEAWVSGKNTP